MCNCSTETNEVVEKILADRDDMLNLERFFFEYTAMKELAMQFTSTSPFKPDEAKYAQVLNEYAESYAMFNILWNAIIEVYAPQYQFQDGYDIRADFENVQLVIVKQNGGCKDGKCENCNIN